MRQLLKFAVVGVLNTALGYAVIFGCMYLLGIGAITSNVVGYAVGLVVSYVLNRAFTFRSAAAPRTEIVRFASTFIVAYLANLGVLLLLIRTFGIHDGVAQCVAGLAYFGLSFFLNKYYVFAASRTAQMP